MRPRFSIAGLGVFVALSGVAFASIRSPSQLWASTLFALALGALPFGVLNAVYSRERARAFWVGFSTVGTLYFVASLGPWFRDEWGPRMVTTAALDLLYSAVSPQSAPAPAPTTVWNNITTWTAVNQVQPAPTPVNPPATANPPVTTQGAIVDDLVFQSIPAPSPVAPAPGVATTAGLPPYPAQGPGVIWLATGASPGNFKSRWNSWTEVDRNDGVGWQIGSFSLQSTAPFRRIGHSLLTLAFATIGGAFAGRKYQKMMTRAARPASAAEPA